ncbi:uncharacterized protein LOC142982822 [Anticarsia gemmatalis]|uniref:uncharacterized protein LOC142982822 n=1 Tax=Anticarsia gemmatalis TaxID=129554 RepID=UPI003F763C80
MDKTDYITVSSMRILWTLKDIALLLAQSICCERFYIAVEDAEVACIEQLHKSRCTGSQKRLYKNVIRLYQATFTEMTACGMFKVFLMVFTVMLWLMKDMVLELLVCVHCERFYIAVENAETACIQRLKNRNCPESQRRLCRDVIQLNRSSFSKMSACGLFYIDASLPVRLVEMITNYVVILLQVAFL